MTEKYNLNNKLVLIKAESLMNQIHCIEAVLEIGGRPILICSSTEKFFKIKEEIENKYSTSIYAYSIDLTNEQEIDELKNTIFSKFNSYPQILINDSGFDNELRSEDNSDICLNEAAIKQWDRIIHEQLTGILLLSKIFGHQMAMTSGGVILNIIPDIYMNPKMNIFNSFLNVKNTALVAIANGLHGFTKYIATYWNQNNIRSNSLTIGNYDKSSTELYSRSALKKQVPIGRLANNDEFKAAIVFLVSDASSYMTGSNLVINGGRTCW